MCLKSFSDLSTEIQLSVSIAVCIIIHVSPCTYDKYKVCFDLGVLYRLRCLLRRIVYPRVLRNHRPISLSTYLICQISDELPLLQLKWRKLKLNFWRITKNKFPLQRRLSFYKITFSFVWTQYNLSGRRNIWLFLYLKYLSFFILFKILKRKYCLVAPGLFNKKNDRKISNIIVNAI